MTTECTVLNCFVLFVVHLSVGSFKSNCLMTQTILLSPLFLSFSLTHQHTKWPSHPVHFIATSPSLSLFFPPHPPIYSFISTTPVHPSSIYSITTHLVKSMEKMNELGGDEPLLSSSKHRILNYKHRKLNIMVMKGA